MDVDVPLGSMDVDVTNIHGYPSSDFTGQSGREQFQGNSQDAPRNSSWHGTLSLQCMSVREVQEV
jgi:hypothetical protein